MKVPFIDLATQYQNLKIEIDQAIHRVLLSGKYLNGDALKEFENNFSAKCGVRNVIGLGNATTGLFLALKALDVSNGDEVITPAWSWISTSEVISLCGAKPVFAEVHPEYFVLTADSIESKITERTKAVILVHLYGQSIETVKISELCKKKNLLLIEDCSQSHFSKESDKILGTIGDCGVFSFYPTKNLGANGNGGCVITNDDLFADKLKRYANHGGLTKDEHLFEGFNSRLDEMQASILNVKLKYIDDWNETRNRNAKIYFENLHTITSISLPKINPNAYHTFHLFVIKAKERDKLKSFLDSKGIQTMIHYPSALPFEPAYTYLNHSMSDFPVSSMLQESVLSLPIVPELNEDQIHYVCEMIKEFYKER
jgi:dTDP-4-amino-4,6-dideoxygalactose transaminase